MNGYFDNASTSFPKPKEVGEWIAKYLANGGTYGRSGHHKSFEVVKVVENVRNMLSAKLGIEKPENLVFCSSATESVNTILNGFNFKYRRVLVDSMSHNAVMRFLAHLHDTIGLEYSFLPHFDDGLIDIDGLETIADSCIDLVIVNHASNVNGVIQNVSEIKLAIGNIPLLVDASQTAGKVYINADIWGLDYLFFTAHKGLLGPTGIGGFYMKDPETIQPYKYGGTGSNSVSELMPRFMPDKFEAGTPNSMGLFGLLGALIANVISLHSREDLLFLIERIKQLDNYLVFCAQNPTNQSELFSLTHKIISNDELAFILDIKYNIQVRSGLHCAPLAHKTLKSELQGAVRFSISPYHTKDDFDSLYDVLKSI